MPSDLHICPRCACELVYPLAWEEADGTRWHILRRCPNCEWLEAAVVSQADCDMYDDELERGADLLAHTYRAMLSENLAGEIDRFAAALAADAIVPFDFGAA